MRVIKEAVSVLVLVVVFLSSAAIVASAVLSPRQTHAGGLTCFTVEVGTDEFAHPKSCNDLCRDKGAVCTGATGIFNPPATCESGIAGQFCRCCAVTP